MFKLLLFNLLFLQFLFIKINTQTYDHLETKIKQFFEDNFKEFDLQIFEEFIFNNKNSTIHEEFQQFFQQNDQFNKNKQNNLICNSCQKVLEVSIDTIANKYQDQIINIIAKLGEEYCVKDFFKDQQQACKNVSEPMAQVVYINFKQKLLSPYTLCSMLEKCPGYTDINIEQEQKRILEIPSQKSNLRKQKQQQKKNANPINFLHVSDIHLDQLYQENSPTTNCGFPFCCQKGQQGEGKAPYWGYLGSCDLPEHTFQQFLQFVNKSVDFDYGIWTGDNQSHDAWESSMERTIEITTSISQQMFDTFGPYKNIYPSLGNEDGFPDYQFDFESEQSYYQNLKDQVSESWTQWIGENSAKQMKEKGFYSSYNEKINLKVISLNTLTCNIKNLFLVPNPTDPGNMLQFLEQELLDSEQKQQNVYIIGHIPSWYCTQDWSQIYQALVQRFSKTIKAQFYGHTHSDQLSIYRNIFDDKQTPNNPLFITPSLTTASRRNPSFRVYQVDPETLEVLNYKQYRLNIDKFNNQGSSAVLQWDLTYEFLSQYNLPDMKIETLSEFAKSLQNDQSLNYQKYRCNYDTSCHVSGNDFNQYSNNTILDNSNSNNIYYCSANFVTHNEYKQCLGQSIEGGKVEQLLSFIEGPWKVKNQT